MVFPQKGNATWGLGSTGDVDDEVVAISAHVQELTGQLVQRLDAAADVNALCVFVGRATAVYPLLAGIDPHDDTCFNPRQAAALADELRTVARHAPEPVSIVARQLLDLPRRLTRGRGVGRLQLGFVHPRRQ